MPTAATRPDFRDHLKKKASATRRAAVEPVESSWQGISAIILACLSIYLAWVPIVNFILAVLALVFGVMGVRTREKVASVAAIVVGAINVVISVVALVAIYGVAWLLTHLTEVAMPGEWLEESAVETPVVRSLSTPTTTRRLDTSSSRESRTGETRRQQTSQTETTEQSAYVWTFNGVPSSQAGSSGMIELDPGEFVMPMQVPTGWN